MNTVSKNFFRPKSIEEYRDCSVTLMNCSASYATKTSVSIYKQIINAMNQ